MSPPDPPPDEKRCTANLSDGSRRCRNYRMRGQRVCESHGGKAPQAEAKAQERLDRAAAPATAALVRTREELEELLDDLIDDYHDAKSEVGIGDILALVGKHQGLVDDILDRTGYPRAKRAEITGKGGGSLRVESEVVEVTEEDV